MYQIIDNFLLKEEFEVIKNTMFGSNFPWFLQSYIAAFDETKDYDGLLLTHMFYSNFSSNSPYFEMLLPLIEKIGVKSLIRIKSNMYPSLEKKQKHAMHVDHYFPHKGAIYHINTNNGHTILEDGTKLESVENRIILFDTSAPHASTSCNDQPFRMNININYF